MRDFVAIEDFFSPAAVPSPLVPPEGTMGPSPLLPPEGTMGPSPLLPPEGTMGPSLLLPPEGTMVPSPLVPPEGTVERRPVLDRLKTLEPGSSSVAAVAVPALEAGEQYRFHFDMRRCIGCRSCEVACHEQNDNPSHVKWRRVGELEGGSYPHARRFHLSMACNHCLEPSCLEGCPVEAYTKLPNGIVAHDEEACIGCQYCSWSCPYGVPTYHPERRVVTKCHLCAERLAGGRLPACVEACPTGAIQIETVDQAAWRQSLAGADAPGLPPARLTLSTTRFTLPEGLPGMMEQAETMGQGGASSLEPEAPHWALVVFLVLSQWSVGLLGAALLLGIRSVGAPAALSTVGSAILAQLALVASLFHLGRPLHAFRALRAWRRSWLSREAILFLLFAVLSGAAAAVSIGRGSSSAPALVAPALVAPALVALGGLGLLAGLGGVYCSARIYLLPGRPAWNSWRTPAQFFLTAALLGPASGLAAVLVTGTGGDGMPGLCLGLGAAASVAALAQALVPWKLADEGLSSSAPAVRASALLLTGRLGKLFRLRTALLVAAAALTAAAALEPHASWAGTLSLVALGLGLLAEGAGRYLFFVTVVPHDMPGHFFGTRHRGHGGAP